MNFDMTTPCNDCPFRREGGIRLSRARVREIAGGLASSQGVTFACHKTTGVAGGKKPTEESHCAGALIFAEKVNPAGTQMMRIAERLRLYDRTKLGGHDGVFDSLREMRAANGRVTR